MLEILAGSGDSVRTAPTSSSPARTWWLTVLRFQRFSLHSLCVLLLLLSELLRQSFGVLLSSERALPTEVLAFSMVAASSPRRSSS